MSDIPRWHAKIRYRVTHDMTKTVEHDFEELDDLTDIVERGPNFYAIEEIVITSNIRDLNTTLAESEEDVPGVVITDEPQGDEPTGTVIDFPSQH